MKKHKEEHKKESRIEAPHKKKNNYVVFIIALVAILVVIAFVYFSSQKSSSDSLEEQFSISSLAYIGYDIQNESVLKAKCAYIRVGRCNEAGLSGGFGESCWFRDVLLKYSTTTSLSSVLCSGYIENKIIGASSFLNLAADPKIKTLTFKLDIRKDNALTVCCKKDNSAEQVCMAETSIKAIC